MQRSSIRRAIPQLIAEGAFDQSSDLTEIPQIRGDCANVAGKATKMAILINILGLIGAETPLEAVQAGEVYRLDRLLSKSAAAPDEETWEQMLQAAIAPRSETWDGKINTDLPKAQLLQILLKHGAPYSFDALLHACGELNPQAITTLLKYAERDGKSFAKSHAGELVFVALVEAVRDQRRGKRSGDLAKEAAHILFNVGFDINACDYSGRTVADVLSAETKQERALGAFLKELGARPSTRDEKVNAITSHYPEGWRKWLHEAANGEHQPMPESMEGYSQASLSLEGIVASIVRQPTTSFAALGPVSKWHTVIHDLADCLRRVMTCDSSILVNLLERRLWAVCEHCGTAVNGDAIQTVAALQSTDRRVVADPAMDRLAKGQCAHCNETDLILCWLGDATVRRKHADLDASYQEHLANQKAMNMALDALNKARGH